MASVRSPGVYRIETAIPPLAPLDTGIAAFLGYADTRIERSGPTPLTLWSQFDAVYDVPADGYLRASVQAFFENGGGRCWVVPLREVDDHGDAVAPLPALQAGLGALTDVEDVDLVCFPDAMRRPGGYPVDPDAVNALQTALVADCDRDGTRLAILDALPAGTGSALAYAAALAGPTWLDQRSRFDSPNAALYTPWVRPVGRTDFVPPCGYVAGVVARTDAATGVHKAPANEQLLGAVDLEAAFGDADNAMLNDAGVNCLRAFPGRGLLVWGARTVSSDPTWLYVNVRRIFLTAARWIAWHLDTLVFEPNDESLWASLRLTLTVYLTGLQRAGALRGATPQEAFYVKCDAENNGPDVRDAGQVVVEIGLATAAPNEFVVVHIIRVAGGVTVTTAGPT